MKIIIDEAGLVDKELNNKIREKLRDTVQELDKSKKYRMDFEFCEDLIWRESEIDSYEIPEEALPPYQRGKVLKGKEKIGELLGYRLDSARNILKEYGIRLGNCNISGIPFMELNKIELRLEEEVDTQLDNCKKRKREKTFTVNMIMPSLSGFAQNLIKACEYIENIKETELVSAFGDKKEYDKYISLMGKDEIYNILTDFKKTYGNNWTYSREYKSELKEKFIKTIEVKAGIVSDDTLKETILKPFELKTVLIFEIPVYKTTKKNSGVKKYVGHIKLLTNGKIINAVFQPSSKTYEIPDETFKECFVTATSKEDNRKLFRMLEGLVNKADENCRSLGYEVEKEIIYNVLVYMDLKSVLKKAGEA